MKAYKIEILVIDFEDCGEEQIKDMIEEVKYPNYAIAPQIMGVEEADIGEWTDNHPLNLKTTIKDEYSRLFKGV